MHACVHVYFFKLMRYIKGRIFDRIIKCDILTHTHKIYFALLKQICSETLHNLCKIIILLWNWSKYTTDGIFNILNITLLMFLIN